MCNVRSSRRWTLAVVLFAFVTCGAVAARADDASFAADVDLSKIRLIAVQNDGRIKTFDSLSREMLGYIAGTDSPDGLDPVYLYLDLMLRPEAYTGQGLIRVKKGPIREELIRAAGTAITEKQAARIRATKRVSLAFLGIPAVQDKLEELDRDVMTTGREIDTIRSAAGLCQPGTLQQIWLVVPPPGGTPQDAWLPIDSAATGSDAPDDATHSTVRRPQPLPGLDPQLATRISASWTRLGAAWRQRDAAGATLALNEIADALPRIEPALYPEAGRLRLEHWYYRNSKMTWIWVVYMASIPFLLMAVVNRWGAARRIGMLLFVAAFVLHSVSTGVRWYLAGRIPNSNMFEAVTATAWFGGAAAWVLEVWLRRRPMRCLFALGAAVCGMAAMMFSHFTPVLVEGSNISNPMPILHTVWLKIHTNLILFSYVLIGLAFVTATLYLVLRGLAKVSRSPALWRLLAGDSRVLAAAGGAIQPMLAMQYDRLGEFHVIGGATGSSETDGPAASNRIARRVALVLSAAGTFVLAALLRGHVQWAVAQVSAGGSAGLTLARILYVILVALTILAGPITAVWLLAGTYRVIFGRDEAAQQVRRSPLPAVLDGTTMILMELAFIALWVGIILGAAWADVSWGRPWGWDPKEVFALNTWIIFLILVHVRLRVQDKGLWTAVLAVAGFIVMMFNWIGVNFFIVGLHSYA